MGISINELLDKMWIFCPSVSNIEWKNTINMTTPRYGASAIQIDDDKTFIIGGANINQTRPYFNSLPTAEIISSNGSVRSVDLPWTFHRGCALKINETTALLIGIGELGDQTWFLDLKTLEF